jgi:DNA-binding LacI/PurR family transcriptional regulator
MANKKKRVASIADVAKAAGVSTATVSRVFNKRDSVHPETRKQVQAAAEKVGFQLSDRRPGPKPPVNEKRPLIRFINFMDLQADGAEVNQTLVPIKRGIESAAEEAGFRPVYNTYSFDDTVTFFPEEGETAGIVLLGRRPSKNTEETLRKYPCCWVMTGDWGPSWGDQVMPDHREVGRLAARELVSKGHKQVALLRFGPRDRVHRFREEGFEYEMERFPEVKWSVVHSGEGPEGSAIFRLDEAIERLAENLKKCSPRPTGVFVDQDRTLFLLYPKLLKAGMAPGKKLEIISCNNLDVYRRQLPFEYKSIDVHFELVGRLSIGQLLWRMKNPGISSQVRSLMLPELP